jgi:hypothetical protein
MSSGVTVRKGRGYRAGADRPTEEKWFEGCRGFDGCMCSVPSTR